MLVRHLDDIVDSELDVRANTWRSRRLLLARDAMGYSLHDTVLYAGTETPMHYRHHLEAVYVIEGEGVLFERDTGITHKLAPGTMYALDRHDRHIVRATTDIRCVCVFNPPLTGQEVHDADGAYPLIEEAP